MKTEFSVVRIKTRTLEIFREIAKFEKTSVPKILDTAAEVLVYEYPAIIEKEELSVSPKEK